MSSKTKANEAKPALSLRLGLFSIFLSLCGWAGAYFGWLPPYSAFRIFALGAVIGGLSSVVAGLISWFRGRGSAELRRGNALGILLGAGLLLGVLALVAPGASAPPIHDLTTDPEDPPQFSEILLLGDNPQRDLTYPHGGPHVSEKQREAYPDLQPIHLEISKSDAFESSRAVVEALGWTLVHAHAEGGGIEAFDTSTFFRFVDDIAIRVRETEGGSIVDLRSTSRVGISDLGANAARIRLFERMLRERAESSVNSR